MDTLKTVPPPEAKLHFLDYWRIIRIRKTVILAVFLLVVFTTVVVTIFLTPSYCGIAKIKVNKDKSDITGMFEMQYNGGYDPYFIEEERQTILSQTVLAKVIEKTGLNQSWGKKYADGEPLRTSETYSLLLRYLDLRPERNANIIEIRFYSQNKDEAARVANEIASTYREYRASLKSEMAVGGVAVLRQQLEEQEKLITQQQGKVNDLRSALQINEYEAQGDAPSPALEVDQLRRLDMQRIDLEVKYNKESSLLGALQTNTLEDLRNILPTVAADNLLHKLLVDLADAKSKLVAVKNDLGAENPEVKKWTGIVAQGEEAVNERVKGSISGLAANVNAEKVELDTLRNQVETARKVDTDKIGKSAPYYEEKRKLEDMRRFRSALKQKIDTEEVNSHLPENSMVVVMNRADPTTMKPVRPNKPLNFALGIIVGLIVGVGLAFFIEYLDTSVKTIDDVERALQSPVLGVIPQNVGRLIDEGAESPHAEAYRVLRTNLLFSRKSDKLNSFAVVSAGAGEGKSTTVFNLATVFAQSGQRVVIVDSDLRRPSLHKFMRVSNTIGLTNYLLKQNTLEEVIQTTGIPTLDFLPSGKLPSSSMGILSSSAMKDLITELKARYDYVFFDSPPIMGVSDASILASEVDMTIQVIQYRRYPQPMNIRAKQTIEKVGGNLVGIVLNNINVSQDESYYYYSGYYHEYYSKNEDGDAAPENAGKKPA